MDDTWKSVLSEIEIEVSKPTFLTFFKGTSLLEVRDSIASISAPTYITAEYLEKRYYSLIKKILDKKLQINSSLVFNSSNKKSAGTKEDKKNIGPLFSPKEEKRVARQERPQRVRKDYTFKTYAVSESNQLAYTAGTTVAKNPGEKYNPLYIYGTVGVGKTHLMQAIANEIFEKHDIKIAYLTTEEFTNEVVEAIRDRTTTQLRKKFRNVDLLLLDDIQFLSGKERVQEELFHTFNSLIDKGKQIIFTSDRPPHEIQKIEARLASRFEGGLTVDIQTPDFELRTAILLIKGKKYNVELGLDMAKIIADKIIDVRALEGFLLRLSTEATTLNKPTSETTITNLLGRKKEKEAIIRPDDIINIICSFYNIKNTQLKGARRDASIVLPRHVCMYLLKEDAGLTFVEIGNILGGRDHTTVIHAVEKIGLLLSNSSKIKEEILFIKNRLKEDYLQ